MRRLGAEIVIPVHACDIVVDEDGRVGRYLSDTDAVVVHISLAMDGAGGGCKIEGLRPCFAAAFYSLWYFGVYRGGAVGDVFDRISRITVARRSKSV